ncbi:TPA: hypothetical protein HA251_07655 [Candidatus Woesearchaeota archaeon]|nr:hypothetical protein [Candidatus Woesearchaeota archaeon]
MNAIAEDLGKVDELVQERWDRLALYHLTDKQVKALLGNKNVYAQDGWFPARYEFEEHAHGRPQLLLVTRGRLTHSDGKMNYTQGTNDLLVVPANLVHTAKVGDEELEFWMMTRRQ